MTKRRLQSTDADSDETLRIKRAKTQAAPSSATRTTPPTTVIPVEVSEAETSAQPTTNEKTSATPTTNERSQDASQPRKGRKRKQNTAVDPERPKTGGEPGPSGHKVRKLVPPRPFPSVPASVSATGPRSAHSEGKNFICITRRTDLSAYLKRCKDVFMKDGYKTLHLSAMGAAIPHLMQLSLSLPGILPFPQDEIHVQVLTGTVEVQDELVPDEEEEDITYRTRGKSTLSVEIKVGDGVDEPAAGPVRGSGRKNNLGRGGTSGRAADKAKPGGRNGGARATEQIVVREDEMDET